MGVQKRNKISAKVAACFSFIVDPTLPKLIFLCGNDPNFAQKKFNKFLEEKIGQ